MNLFAAPPNDPKFASEPLLVKVILPTHIIIAVLILMLAISVFVNSIRDQNPEFKKTAGQGLSSVIFAIGGGLATVFLKDIAAEIASLVMAISFLSAFIAYGRFYYVLRAKNK
jgi:hypothetical protein